MRRRTASGPPSLLEGFWSGARAATAR
nr:TPA_asm: M51 iORF [Murid betaherpesvirus 1]DBA07996.1 TPA_asm: M51 iORF [Murid betaherpesvirus 1]